MTPLSMTTIRQRAKTQANQRRTLKMRLQKRRVYAVDGRVYDVCLIHQEDDVQDVLRAAPSSSSSSSSSSAAPARTSRVSLRPVAVHQLRVCPKRLISCDRLPLTRAHFGLCLHAAIPFTTRRLSSRNFAMVMGMNPW